MARDAGIVPAGVLDELPGKKRPLRLTRTLRRLALRCAVLPVPRAGRARIIDELEDEYPAIVARRGGIAAMLWYARELASLFSWYLLQRLPGRRSSTPRLPGSTPMNELPSLSTHRLSPAAHAAGALGDARGALRGMRKSPAFTALAIAVLAIGIGSTTAVFSVFDWVLLREPPGVASPEQLVTVRLGDNAIYSFGHPLYAQLEQRAQSLAGLAAYSKIAAHVADRNGTRIERVAAEVVSGNFFEVLGVTMAQGRGFAPDEAARGSGARVVVISERLRRRWFPVGDATGQEILLSGTPFRVIGVTTNRFHGAEHPGEADVWVTLASHEASLPHWGDAFESSGGVWMHMVGRLRDDVELAAARQELVAIYEQIAEEFGAAGWFRDLSLLVTEGTGTFAARERAAGTLRVMSTVVAALLLLTCANVANMVLARATGRREEMALRRVLGATRGRLAAQLLVESAVLAVAGGVVAVAVAFGIVELLEGAHVLSWMPPLQDVPVDLDVLGFALFTSLMTGIVFGLAPAISLSRPAMVRRGGVAGGRVRDGLVVAQLALSVTLLVGAGLLSRTLVNMRAIDLGIERDNLVFFSVDPALQGYDDARTRTLMRQVVDDLAALPRVEAVSASFPEAFGRMRSSARVARWGEDAEENGLLVDNAHITPGYFTTMDIDLIEGSTFDADLLVESQPARRKAIVNESLARKLFPDGPAVGRELTMWDPREDPVPFEIVAVSRDAHLRRLLDDDVDIVYEPYGQRYLPQQVSFQLRSGAPAETMLAAVRAAMHEADAALPAFDVVTAVDKIDGTIAEHRLVTVMSGALAAIALLLAGVGIYGVLGTAVRMRFHEIGVRMALGARGRDVLGGVLRRSLALGALGVAVGLLGAFQVAGLIRSRLYGIDAFDPAVFIASAAAVLLLSLVASLVPARRATSVSPVDVLRSD